MRDTQAVGEAAMRWRGMVQVFGPGAAAALAGGAAHLAWGAPVATALAAGIGATAVALAMSRTEDFVEARGTRRPDRGPGTAAGDLPAGLGRALLGRLPMAVLLVNRSGHVDFMNAAATELFGHLPPGRSSVATLRAPKLLDAIDASLSEGLSGTVHFSVSRTGGVTLHLRGHVRRIDAAGEAAPGSDLAALVVIEDETRSRRAEDLHRDFVANASHELKTPLASITAIIETLQGHARDDPDATERFVALMGTQAQRMKRLVEDLLSLNRIEVNERVQPREPQDAWRIAADTVELLSPLAAERGMTVEAGDAPAASTVLGSREELGQVFQNLIENALKYGRAGGRVRVEAVAAPDAQPGRIGISVVDDGPGIPREHIPRLTERFYRVSVSRSRERGGTGLGLAIVKHVVSRHRGQLEIESADGEGARFTVWLPLARDDAGVVRTAGRRGRGARPADSEKIT